MAPPGLHQTSGPRSGRSAIGHSCDCPQKPARTVIAHPFSPVLPRQQRIGHHYPHSLEDAPRTRAGKGILTGMYVLDLLTELADSYG